ncbi:MAG: hypothetical protein RI885_1034 [Actinomycetota bacterium]|jgi:aryl-alcohol dehydrogenase-like predicted oxidoreductase
MTESTPLPATTSAPATRPNVAPAPVAATRRHPRPEGGDDTPVTGPISVRRRAIGHSDLRVFPLAIGGNVFGWTADAAAVDGILDTYSDLGGNFVDTADSYAAGRSEIMIGDWMRDRRMRSHMVVATKVGKGDQHPGVTQKAITRSVEASLQRLRTDYIDLLYLHIDDEAVPFEETLLAVDALVGAGKVRYVGASDHSGNRLIEARVISAQLGAAPLVAVQNQYNLVHRREYEGTIARVASQLGLGVMPRFALASGFLSGKYRSRSDAAASRRRSEVSAYVTRFGLRVLSTIDQIAAEHHVAPASVALAWLLTKPNIVAPVVSASSSEQVLDLVAAVAVPLTRHQVAELDRVSA